MGVCSVRSGNLSWYNGDVHRRCTDCVNRNKWPNGHPKQTEQASENHRTSADEAAVIPTTPSSETSAATAFTPIAWVVVGLSLICSAIAALALAADGQGFMAIIVFVSGCFSAVLLGLWVEISANIARLVNKSS